MQSLESKTPNLNSLRFARVSRTYPDRHCVDVVFLDDGGFASGVPILSPMASQTHGMSYLPKVEEPSDANGRWSTRLTGQNDMLCAVGWCAGLPMVLGFYFPPGGHLASEANERLDRHISGFEERMTPEGDLTLTHPSGWTLRMTKADGIMLDVDGTRLALRPDGTVTIDADNDLTINAAGATFRASGGTLYLN
ncbi:MAG: hypothetical protein MZV65_31605 [Chromatiales bacterium]|nr:hypothetical protein [Chromatiales bacterium]